MHGKKELPGYTQFIIYFVSILFLELSFPLVLHHAISLKTFLHIILFDGILSSILSIGMNITGKKSSFISTIIILVLFATIFSIQGVFYRIFKVYFSINTINEYIKNEKPTSKNEYTGMWKGYNLIYITAESFSEIGISKELTPTLYKLTHSGFQFKNFYIPNILSTIGGEFQSLTGLYPDYSILSQWRDGYNYYPFSIGTTFENLGYSTNAYHNNWYAFQDRDSYLRSQGLGNYLGCYNELEERMNCEI